MSQQNHYAWHGHFLIGLTSVKDIISVLEDQPRSETMKFGGLLLVLALLGLGVFTPWLGLVGDDRNGARRCTHSRALLWNITVRT